MKTHLIILQQQKQLKYHEISFYLCVHNFLGLRNFAFFEVFFAFGLSFFIIVPVFTALYQSLTYCKRTKMIENSRRSQDLNVPLIPKITDTDLESPRIKGNVSVDNFSFPNDPPESRD